MKKRDPSQRWLSGFALQLPQHKPWYSFADFPGLVLFPLVGVLLGEVAWSPTSKQNDGLWQSVARLQSWPAWPKPFIAVIACWYTRTVMVEVTLRGHRGLDPPYGFLSPFPAASLSLLMFCLLFMLLSPFSNSLLLGFRLRNGAPTLSNQAQHRCLLLLGSTFLLNRLDFWIPRTNIVVVSSFLNYLCRNSVFHSSQTIGSVDHSCGALKRILGCHFIESLDKCTPEQAFTSFSHLFRVGHGDRSGVVRVASGVGVAIWDLAQRPDEPPYSLARNASSLSSIPQSPAITAARSFWACGSCAKLETSLISARPFYLSRVLLVGPGYLAFALTAAELSANLTLRSRSSTYSGDVVACSTQLSGSLLVRIFNGILQDRASDCEQKLGTGWISTGHGTTVTSRENNFDEVYYIRLLLYFT
ncbi:hypothetical protein Tco_0464825 [Tanacetum coccineum]